MPALNNNRDLYDAIRTLRDSYADTTRSLETYLRTVVRHADALCLTGGISRETLYALLCIGFIDEPLPFDESWRSAADVRPTEAATYAGWRTTVTRQIAELRDMEEAAQHMGWDVQSLAFSLHEKWRNTTIAAYLHSASKGVFGTVTAHQIGRPYTPSEVVELGGGAVDPMEATLLPPGPELPEPELLSWEVMGMFVRCGRRFR